MPRSRKDPVTHHSDTAARPLLDGTLDEYLARLASAAPAPGGGSVAALAAVRKTIP